MEGEQHYRKAQKQERKWGKQRFKLRFPELQNSILKQSIFELIKQGVKMKFKYTNQSTPKDLKKLQEDLPIIHPKFQTFQDKINYTWIGHSTAVISIGKKTNFIIDPVFSKRAFMNQSMGPERFRKAACQIQQLPKIDAVLISHDHYDHLDQNSLKQIERKFTPKYFVGLRSKDVLPDKANVIEMDWTESVETQLNGSKFKITFVPACHWSKRGLNDDQIRLWGGFVIETPNKKKIFYAGDTGYCGIFKQLGQQFGGFDLSIIPIGAYHPRELFKAQHIDPQEAVIIHKQIKSKKSVGVHWGTFPLTFEHCTAAREDLQLAKTKHDIKPDQFITVSHGGSFTIDL